MLPIVFHLDIFEIKPGSQGDYLSWRYSTNVLKWLLEALVNCNRDYIKLMGGNVPPLYETGVRYTRENTEDWAGIKVCWARKYGDCEDLASWRVAELREQGEPARPYLRFKRGGADKKVWQYHIQVLRYKPSDASKAIWVPSSIEDPSLILGMNWKEGKPLFPNRLIKTGV